MSKIGISKEIKLTCVRCGESFYSVAHNAKYCTACKSKGKGSGAKKAAAPAPEKPKEIEPLHVVAAKARAAGMNYGQYMAKMRLEGKG